MEKTHVVLPTNQGGGVSGAPSPEPPSPSDASAAASDRPARREDSRRHNVLLLGNYRASLPVIRSLARAGHRVFVGYAGRYGSYDYVERSRHATAKWQHPDYDELPVFFSALDEFVAQEGISVIYPVCDWAVRFAVGERARFPKGVPVVMTPPSVVAQCADKVHMLRVCDQAGVKHARYAVVSDLDELYAAAREWSYPCVLKPADAAELLLGKKAWIFRSEGEVLSTAQTWPPEHRQLIMQTFVEGPRHNVSFCSYRGKVFAAMQLEVRRTDRYDGTGFAVEGVTVPLTGEFKASCEVLAEALDYTGVGQVQFMTGGPGGEPSFLELNPRLEGNVAVYEHCGLPLSLIAFDLALGNPPSRIADPFTYPLGVRFAWTTGDLAGLIAAVRLRHVTWGQALRWLGRAVWTGATADMHLTWDWRDPLPTLKCLTRLTNKYGRISIAYDDS